jgi:hypothetical protein
MRKTRTKETRVVDHPLYRRWTHIRQSVLNPNSPFYRTVGAQGIKISPRLWDFWDFVQQVEDHLGPQPSAELKLSRIDQTKDYTIKNLEWAPMIKVGSRYKKTQHLRSGKKSQSIKQWELETGVKYCTIYSRIRRGWSINKAINTQP